jgi:hypothetical protein
MTLIILKNDQWFAVIGGVPGNVKPSRVLAVWLEYLGINHDDRDQYSAQWISNTDYRTMERWCSFQPKTAGK